MFSSSPTISTMQEFFKTAVSNKNHNNDSSNEDIHRHRHTDSESMPFTDDSHPIKSHHLLKPPQTSTHTNGTNTAGNILPSTMNMFLPHHDFKYGIGGGSSTGKKNAHHGMSETEIKGIVFNSESFHIIQERLRVNYRAQSNAVAKQVAIHLIREQFIQQQEQRLRDEQQSRQEQRKLQIARELTEARIKSQQALKLKVRKNNNDSDSDDGCNDDDEGSHSNHHHEDCLSSNKNTTNSHSPTSVMTTCVSIPDDVLATNDTFPTAPLMSMNSADYDSEDGDILEVIE